MHPGAIMKLSAYKKKRDFHKTPEPKAKIKSTKNKLFVIQRHDARRLHFDVRLELGGVLKSLAVPKGLPLGKEKRMAVQTEDHPLDYANFQGKIPEGQYGAGDVLIWDKGTYSYLQKDNKTLQQAIDKGHFVLKFHGNTIKDKYAFTKTKQNWIVVRKKVFDEAEF